MFLKEGSHQVVYKQQYLHALTEKKNTHTQFAMFTT